MTPEQWLEKNTFRCALGRVSPAQCQANRARPNISEGKKGPWKPGPCETCNEWEMKIMEMENEKIPEPVQTKKCIKCGEEKPLNEFHKDNARSDGHKSICKACSKARRKASSLKAKSPLLDSAFADFLVCADCGFPINMINDEEAFFRAHMRYRNGECRCMPCAQKYAVQRLGRKELACEPV